jgi:ribosomal protein S18 acetylase RimI-like enzyme
MKKDDLITLADLNYAEFMREMGRWNAASEIIEQDDLLIIAGADSTPVTNCAIRVGDQARPPADEVMERVRTCFDNRKRDYSLRLRGHQDSDLEELCRSAEMIKISEAPGMSIHDPLPVKRLPPRVKVRVVKDKAGADDYASVVIDSYRSMKMPVVTGQKIFETAERMLRPYNYVVVAYLEEKPVSGAMITFSHSIAGIYWVGTVESARKKGLAEACVGMVTNEAFKRGASCVVLQASKFGEPLYRRLGFREFTRYPWYMHFQGKNLR